jgi:hypothetical protein
MSVRRILPILFLFTAALTLAPSSSIAKVGLVVGIAPPAPVVETIPPPPAPPGNVWQGGLLGLGWHQIRLGARGIHGGPLSRRRVDSRSLDQTRPRLGLGRRPLAAVTP